MKNINVYIICTILLLVTNTAFAEPPGGGYNGCRYFFASFDVDDENGDPVEGVDVKVLIQIFGTEGDNSDILYGTTNSQGWVNLSTTLCYLGYELGHSMLASLNDDRYTVTSSSNTSTTTSYNLYPSFDVVLDLDQNGIHDDWELPLAEKFCPSFKLHSQDQGVSPEPVEIMGDYYGLWARVWTIGYSCIGDWLVEDDPGFNPPLSDIFFSSTHYYWFGHWGGENPHVYIYQGTPPGFANDDYLILFHFDWAGPEEFGQGGEDDPSGWFDVYANGNGIGPGYGPGSNYSDTVYGHLFKSGSDVVLQYWFFYPFNDQVNNHEGDWEHINVIVTNQNPNSAQISRVDFYFHHHVVTRWPGNFEVDDTYHPIVYVGGYGSSVVGSGPGSHGSFPSSGTWEDAGELGVNDYVDGLGRYINYSGINIVVIPSIPSDPFDWFEFNGDTWDWLRANIPWGQPTVSSPGDWIPKDVGNHAPGGPAFNGGWEKTGVVSGDYESYP